ncbi:leucine-rich repeat extensin-like protein 1 [Prosopis cineraria]|uniref:leucine-rich repeat extensin-like protein 1 n=1 Tax=Prosopis cineraria TaxID=364024 RepID=UPI00240F887F|nr:leucine-rich repeat extensin-like protein 1 [Prosopis cineraria]
MSPAKYLLLVAPVVAVVVLFSVCEVSGDDVIPPKCDPPCQVLPPPTPPLSGDPSYGAPPPPYGYSIYDAPPPPHKGSGQKKCPPAAPQVQCCPPPYPYYTHAPPFPYYTYAPPYTYVPYGEGGSLLVPILASLMMIFSSFIFLF